MTENSRLRVEERAYELYLARGGEHGRDMDDWLAAEQELESLSLLQATNIQEINLQETNLDSEFEELLRRNALAFSASAAAR